MEQLWTVGISLLFLFIGYFLGRSKTEPELGKQVFQNIKKFPVKTAIKAGILEYASQADIDYERSGEAKVDEERERVFREQFKP